MRDNTVDKNKVETDGHQLLGHYLIGMGFVTYTKKKRQHKLTGLSVFIFVPEDDACV